jgi:atypical dual specificity phosphatase
MHNYNDIWWAINHVLGGMGIPYIDQMRRYHHGGALDAYHDELPAIHRTGVRAVVCLLNIKSDAPVFQSAGFEFLCLPVEDGQPPTLEQAREFISYVDACRARNLPVAVFCEAGAGRTGCMICCYLIHSGQTAAEAIARARALEPSAVERVLQIKFLEEFEELVKGGQH